MLQHGAVRRGNGTGKGSLPSTPGEKAMRSLLKPNLLLALQQNAAGLMVDLGILAIFLVLLAVR